MQAEIPQLREKVLKEICSKFGYADSADPNGWNALSHEAVMLVLCSKLQVYLFSLQEINVNNVAVIRMAT